MPRKFRCYVRKGAGRKARKGTSSFPCEEDASHNTVEQTEKPVSFCIDVGVQTDELCLHCIDAEIQTEISMMSQVDIAVQTDEQTFCTLTTTTAGEQNDNLTLEESSILVDDLTIPDVQVDSLQICEGNDEEKFLPLIKKHKGAFTNAKGT